MTVNHTQAVSLRVGDSLIVPEENGVAMTITEIATPTIQAPIGMLYTEASKTDGFLQSYMAITGALPNDVKAFKLLDGTTELLINLAPDTIVLAGFPERQNSLKK